MRWHAPPLRWRPFTFYLYHGRDVWVLELFFGPRVIPLPPAVVMAVAVAVARGGGDGGQRPLQGCVRPVGQVACRPAVTGGAGGGVQFHVMERGQRSLPTPPISIFLDGGCSACPTSFQEQLQSERTGKVPNGFMHAREGCSLLWTCLLFLLLLLYALLFALASVVWASPPFVRTKWVWFPHPPAPPNWNEAGTPASPRLLCVKWSGSRSRFPHGRAGSRGPTLPRGCGDDCQRRR